MKNEIELLLVEFNYNFRINQDISVDNKCYKIIKIEYYLINKKPRTKIILRKTNEPKN